MKPLRAQSARGFTLVELLVALVITAIMFTIGYRALDQALTSRKELEEQSAKLLALQQAMRIMEQDFELLQPRPVRNIIGDGYMGAMIAQATGGIGSLGSQAAGSSSSFSSNDFSSSSFSSTLSGSTPPLVTFTRGGWTNPVGIQRSELQRVSYSIENGALIRSYYPVLDATEGVLPIKRTLIDHVKNFNLRFMDAGRNWQTTWPPITLGGVGPATQLRFRPIAVEVKIEIEGWGVLTRHIEVAG